MSDAHSLKSLQGSSRESPTTNADLPGMITSLDVSVGRWPEGGRLDLADKVRRSRNEKV